MPKLKNIENKHLKSEKLFSRGLVSIQMSIESHRQQIEYLESLFETENDILVSLGELSVIDGDLSRFKQLLQGSSYEITILNYIFYVSTLFVCK